MSTRRFQLLTGWLPTGLISTEQLEEIVRRAVPGGWVDHPSFWAVATDTTDGKRDVFGRDGAPEAELPKAVAASCAIPGFYRPVTIGRRRYVDGGVCSASNLDLLKDAELDLVICLNPTSSLASRRRADPRRWSPAGRAAMRAGAWAARPRRCAPPAPRWC